MQAQSRYVDDSQKYNFVYKTTNTINNRTYTGVHRTTNINDGYLGSGKLLKKAIAKYGKENFTREIIAFFDTYQEALDKERELVNMDYINRDDTYNLKEGGFGSCRNSDEQLRFYGSEERRKRISENFKRWIKENPEKHAERMHKINKNPEKIRKMAEKHRGTKRSAKARENIARAIRESNVRNPDAVLRKSGKGRTYKYNIETKEVARCNKTDLIELPWIFGSGPKKSKENYQGMHKGSIFIYNEVTDTMSRIPKDTSIPEGFKKGKRPTYLYGRFAQP